MKNKILYLSGLAFFIFLIFSNCKEDSYALGDLTAPSNLVISTAIVGQDASNPNGDGSGVVNITATGQNVLTYKIGYNVISDVANPPTLNVMSVDVSTGKATATKKFSQPTSGTYTYRITVVAYGIGGTSTVVTKDISVLSVFTADPVIVTNLTNNASKTWKVDQNTAGHFGVGPWNNSSVTPEWWSAAPNEKAGCCNCFYTARFTFKQTSTNKFSLVVATPDGAFTKTGALASIPGIPASGDEGCYAYSGGTSDFNFAPAGSGLATSTPSTQTSIVLGGSTTFIGYGALQKEYEILEITPTYLYLRVQGTETGNAWYIKLIPAP